MIYADNNNADILKQLSKKKVATLLRNEFHDPEIQIIEKRNYYWKEGTHYYSEKTIEPNLELPENTTIIGELVSKNQGWCGPVLQNISNLSKGSNF